MSRPRFVANHDLTEAIIVGVLRREPSIEFLRCSPEHKTNSAPWLFLRLRFIAPTPELTNRNDTVRHRIHAKTIYQNRRAPF